MAAAAAALPAAEEPAAAVRAGRLHLADGRTLPDALVVIQRGRYFTPNSSPGGFPPRTTYECAVASAGFVDLWAVLPAGEEAEDPRPFAPALRAADGFDPADRAAAAAAREGVLRRLVLPSDRNPLGGSAAMLRVSRADGRLAVADASAGLVLSFAQAAARPHRYPGSLAGIVRGLEATFDGVTGQAGPFAGPDPALGAEAEEKARLAELARPGSRAFLYARTRGEARAALRFAAARRLRPVIVDPRCGGEALLEAAAAAGFGAPDLAAIFSLDAADPRFHLEAPGRLARAGATVGFGSGWPGPRGPDAVRFAAALAVRHGMEPDAARAALLGRGFGVPGLAPGDAADLVLLDGDPVDPSSRILEVLAGGEPLARKGRP